MVFDTDVIIWGLRDHARALAQMEADAERAVSVVTRLELLHGVHDKRELANLRRFLREFATLPLTEDIGALACSQLEQHGLRVRLDPMDALIAATAITHKVPLCTGNIRHFRTLDEIEIVPFRP